MHLGCRVDHDSDNSVFAEEWRGVRQQGDRRDDGARIATVVFQDIIIPQSIGRHHGPNERDIARPAQPEYAGRILPILPFDLDPGVSAPTRILHRLHGVAVAR